VKRLRSAILGGLVASLAMDLVQGGFAQVFERDRAPGEKDEEVEAIAGVVRLLRGFAPSLFPQARSETAGHVLHYLFGGAFGLAYAFVRERDARVSSAYGLVFGTGLWLLSDRILIPSTKLGRPWGRYSLAERTNALASHLAFGAALEAVLRRTAA